MKHALKSRTICLASALTTTAILAGCSKEKTKTPPPQETYDYDSEETLYVTDQNQMFGGSATYYCSDFIPGSPMPRHWFDIKIRLDKTSNEKIKDKWISNDTLFHEKTFSLQKIVSIDLLLLTDYDKDHLKGSSLNDQFEIQFSDPQAGGQTRTMDLVEYFKIYGSLDWREGTICLLVSKTLPSGDNGGEFFDLRKIGEVQKGFGAMLRLTLEDKTVIETNPSIALCF